jgi:hypothetical protein|tara:strand:+ start:891 stop:1163 length:273 start_codon:yes stop_codon:yes gene_type:complete
VKQKHKDKIMDELIPEDVSNAERRRLLNFGARFLITICQFGLLVLMLFLLFYQIAPDSSRDLVSAIVGMLVISQKDAVQYWFNQHHPDKL